MATEGLDDILKAFEGLKKGAQAKVMRQALNAALVPVVKELRASAKKGSKPHKTYKGRLVAPGFLSRSVIKSTRLSKDKHQVFGNVRLKSEAWYGSLLEHGWRPGKRSRDVKRASKRKSGKGGLSDEALKSLGDKRTKITGTKWFSKAVKRSEEEIYKAYADKMQQAILKEFRK